MPTWDGNLALLTTYERELRWYVMGTNPEKRGLCGPRALRQLTGRTRGLVSELDKATETAIASPEGVNSYGPLLED